MRGISVGGYFSILQRKVFSRVFIKQLITAGGKMGGR